MSTNSIVSSLLIFMVIELLFLVCQAGFFQSIATLETQASKYSIFEDVHIGKRLIANSSLIRVIQVPFRTLCTLACNKDPRCRSINFCSRVMCELNAEDIFSTLVGNTILENNRSCKYLGMWQTEQPICSEKGELTDINKDPEHGKCLINKKKVDEVRAHGCLNSQ